MIEGLYDFAKKWCEKGSIWIISDPHFEDADCRYIDAEWPSPELYIDRLNHIVFKNDTLICLGDCGNLEWFTKLKCQNLVLIKGNHDDGKKSQYTEVFKEVYEGPLFISNRILLSHEQIFGLPFAVNIHGHRHDWTDAPYTYYDLEYAKHVCLAANVVAYQPFNLGAAIKEGLLSDVENIHRIDIEKRKARNLLDKL